MNEREIFARLGLALAIGFLVGVERGWREREAIEGERTAGLRTFALIGLLGGLSALLAEKVGGLFLAFVLVAVAAIITLFRWREAVRDKDFGATTLVAALVTFGLGAYAVLGNMVVAAATGVATAALLAAKSWLHAWLRHLSWEELRATLTLLAMSLVALPVLPDVGYGPFEAFNPYRLWLMAVAIAGVSFAGYVAVKVAGSERGVLIGGAAGGLVSSTVATVDLARKARLAPERWRLYLAGALAASAVMFVRVFAVVAVFRPALLERLGIALAAGALILAGLALLLEANVRDRVDGGAEVGYRNPFDILPVLRFAVLLWLVLVLSRALAGIYGGSGAIGLAALTGLADVDAISLSMTQLGESSVAASVAATAIFVAVAANAFSKSVLAIALGGARFGAAYALASALAVGVGLGAAQIGGVGLFGGG